MHMGQYILPHKEVCAQWVWTISVSFKSHSLSFHVANAHIWKCPQHHFKLLE